MADETDDVQLRSFLSPHQISLAMLVVTYCSYSNRKSNAVDPSDQFSSFSTQHFSSLGLFLIAQLKVSLSSFLLAVT
jgi:hypothetical protein